MTERAQAWLLGWRASAAVATASAVTAVPTLWNKFAYDDIPFVLTNPAVTSGRAFTDLMQEPYWAGGLFRPLSVWLLSLQWQSGHGRPWVFHATSLVLAVTVACLVLVLAQRLLPRGPAFLAAILFAVHPVHTEAVGNIVGQAELLAAMLVLVGVLVALPDLLPLSKHSRLLAVVLAAAAAPLAKEQGFMLPAVLAIVLLLRPSPLSFKARLDASAPPLLAAVAGALPVLLWRTYVLKGIGQEPLEILANASHGQRLLMFLELVHEWTRLLLWPAQLQAEYSPPQLASTIVGIRHLWGMATLTLALWLAWTARGRAPVLTLGIAWVAVTIFPVSNLLFLTGILLAERTLYLPSVGACLAAAAAGAVALARLPHQVRSLALGAVVGLVIVATWHSARRAAIWHDNDTLYSQGVLDAPHSYRSWKVYGMHLAEEGRLVQAEGVLRTSLQLWDRDAEVYEQLTRVLRRMGQCDTAIAILRDGLKRFPEETVLRARLVECLIQQGRLTDAREVAKDGEALGDPASGQMMRRVDSASTRPHHSRGH